LLAAKVRDRLSVRRKEKKKKKKERERETGSIKRMKNHGGF